MAAPARGGDDLERGLLERPRDEEVVDDARGAQARAGGAAGADARHAQAGGGRLGQRAHVDDVPVGVVGGQRGRRVGVGAEVARPVVLEQEGAGARDGVEHRAASVGREHGAVRVGVQRLAVDQARAGALEGLGEEVGAHAVGVAGDRDDAQAGRAGGDDRAEVGRRLDEHRHRRRSPARGTPWRGPAGRRSRRRRRGRAGCRRPGARTTRAAPRGPRPVRAPRRRCGAPRGPAPRRRGAAAAGRATGSRSTAGWRRAAGPRAAPAAPCPRRRPRRARRPARRGRGRPARRGAPRRTSRARAAARARPRPPARRSRAAR